MAMKKGSKQLGYGGSITSLGADYVMARGEQNLIKGAKKTKIQGPSTTDRNMVGKVPIGQTDGPRYRAAEGSSFGMIFQPKATKSVSFSSKPKAKVVAKKK